MKTLLCVMSLVLAPAAAMAQSKIQCVQGAQGEVQAALIWQNTLGAHRANEICRASIRPHETTTEKVDALHRRERVGRFDRGVYERAAEGRGAPRSVDARMNDRSPGDQPVEAHDGGLPSAAPVPDGFVKIW